VVILKSAGNAAIKHANDGQTDHGKGERGPAESKQNTEKLEREREQQKGTEKHRFANSLHHQRDCINEVFEVVKILYQAFHQRTIVNIGPTDFASSAEESESCMALEFDCFAWAIAR
jgi:hypothetical protein